MKSSRSSGSTEVDYSGFFNRISSYYAPDNYVSNPSYYDDYFSYYTSNSSSGTANPVHNTDGTEAMKMTERGEDGGGSGLTLSETNTMATVMELTNTFTMSLIKWGVRQATTSWGNSISGLNKFSKVSGKFLGYYSAFAYGMQARNAYNNGDRLHTLSNGLMSFYSLVATKGCTPGLVFTAPFFVIDLTFASSVYPACNRVL